MLAPACPDWRFDIAGACGPAAGAAPGPNVRVLGHVQDLDALLAGAGVALHEGYDAARLASFAPDLVVVGNAGLPRGHAAVEYVLNNAIPYTSGAQWLGEHVLAGRWVLGVSGTHGKTTTSSMLAWILEYAGLQPGYLIGGVPANFDTSARLEIGRAHV